MCSGAPNLAYQLPADAYYHLIHTLRVALPSLTDSPEDLLRRDHAAIARIAALAPANAVEADLAAQFVAASEQWKDCLRLAQLPEAPPAAAAKCRAQALGMMRQANSALRLLIRLQSMRHKAESDGAAGDRAARIEHCAIGLMAEALANPGRPHPDPLPEGEGEAATFPLCLGEGQSEGAEGEGKAATSPLPLGEDQGESADLAAAAVPQKYGGVLGVPRLPRDSCHFDPPEAALVAALIAARPPALSVLDDEAAAEALL